MRITEQQVQQAEQKARAAEEERDVAAGELARSPYSDVAAMKHSESSRLAAQLRANARELWESYEKGVEEERLRMSRPVLEKAAEAEVEAAGVELEQREREVVEALTRAQEANAGVLAAAEAYNAAVQSHADVLAGAGLDVHGGASGGSRSILNAYTAKVRGRVYEQLGASVLAGWALHRVLEARLSRFNDVAVALRWVARAGAQSAPGVVAAVPDVAAVRREEPRRGPVVAAVQALLGAK